MKIKENSFVVQQIDTENFAIPVGEATSEMKGIIRLNDAGCFLWNLLQNENDINGLVNELIKEYDVDREQATIDVEEFIHEIEVIGCLE